MILILVVFALVFGLYYLNDVRMEYQNDSTNIVYAFFIGLVTDFFDTLGIGSFATTTAIFKVSKNVEDSKLPGTLNVAHAIPIIVEALFFIKIVEVDLITLVSLIIASIIGSYLGAKYIVNVSIYKIKLILGFALLGVAIVMFLNTVGLIDSLGLENTANSLSGIKLVIGICAFFILGALMSFGVGLYAPAMAVVYLLGLNPLVAFPIMMGSCAYLMPFNSYKFIKEKAYYPKLSFGISVGGVIGVVLAATLVTTIDLTLLTRIVIIIISVIGVSFINEAKKIKEDTNELSKM